ncbi:prepilin-type N-terminal cleavage/methylation domain-containing protein [Pseudophaeobacter sp.]|uniref:prepilin-type N-terminal cleavage/methylation domain-containing protein n=1 Tax=Pseudophaeobacter sp. TaxID=1971739 RepID=UPI003296A709
MDPELEPDLAQGAAGFTLVELLVSIAVLAVLALGATLALPRSSAPAGSDMALFQRQFEQMRQLAITGQSSRGLIIAPEGLRLASRWTNPQTDPQVNSLASPQAGYEAQTWRISPRQQRWQGRVYFTPQDTEGRAPPGSSTIPDIQFLADGRSSAFRIRFSQGSGSPGGGGRQAYCHSDGRTGLICEGS